MLLKLLICIGGLFGSAWLTDALALQGAERGFLFFIVGSLCYIVCKNVK